MFNLTTEMISVDRLNPAPYNPRKDLQPGDPVYEKLLRNVEEFGYVEPIVWNRRTGNVVGGHQRLKVLKQLGADSVLCVVLDIDPLREKALNVALNKIGGEFDDVKLSGLLRELDDSGFDTTLTGFGEVEQKALFERGVPPEPSNIKEDDYDAAAEAEAITDTITRLGDIWTLGRHRLLVDDSTDQSAVARLMDGAKARLTFTDPPWNISYGESQHPNWKRRSILNDNMTQEDFHEFLVDAAKAMASVSEPGALTYLVMSAKEWGNLMPAMQRAGFHWSSTIIWYKDKFVLSQKEPIWFGWLDGTRRLVELRDRTQSDVWEIPRPQKSDEHPMMKPIALVTRALQNSSHFGDIVLDAFGGSGTTLIACEEADRLCRTMELDPKYCDVIVKRFCLNHPADSVFLLRGRERLTYTEAQGRSDFVEITDDAGDPPF